MSILNKKVASNHFVKVTEPTKFFFSLGIGLLMGVLAFSNATVAILYVGVSILPLYFAFQNNTQKVLTTVPYLVYAEIYFRTSGSILPYLFCQYCLLAVFSILLLRKGIVFKIYSRSFVFLFLFSFVEVFNSFRTDNINVARSSIIQTLLLFIISIWSSSTVLSPELINTLIKNLKIAGLWLCGYILAAHLTGNIKYELVSSFESTNGLAPVQISAYLGLLSFLFFLSIVNGTDQRNLVLNTFFMIISTTLMVLSFSRGGVYFIGILVSLYFIINIKKMSNYFMFFLLLPMASIIYYFVGEATNGLVNQRFAEEGASGRDILVKIGFDIFLKNPVAGIGTGNFNTEIIKDHLYAEESGAHNEFIRVIAEHGILGIFTYWVFYFILFYEIMQAKTVKREYAFYFFVLFCLILIHNGLKIGLQPIILLLAISIPHSASSVTAKSK